jgi:hypothetical protein
MSRPRHPNKHIEAALKYAESCGWRVVTPAAHAWGRILCALESRDGCAYSIWSTPKNPENFAKRIRRYVDNCPHGAEE